MQQSSQVIEWSSGLAQKEAHIHSACSYSEHDFDKPDKQCMIITPAKKRSGEDKGIHYCYIIFTISDQISISLPSLSTERILNNIHRIFDCLYFRCIIGRPKSQCDSLPEVRKPCLKKRKRIWKNLNETSPNIVLKEISNLKIILEGLA